MNTKELEEKESYKVAMNIVNQIMDDLMEKSKVDVGFRQSNNERYWKFADDLIESLLREEKTKSYDEGYNDGYDDAMDVEVSIKEAVLFRQEQGRKLANE